MASNIRVTNAPLYTGINDGGLANCDITKIIVCANCGKTVKVPSSYMKIKSDFDDAEFCSYNCRCNYYKTHEQERDDYFYKQTWEYRQEQDRIKSIRSYAKSRSVICKKQKDYRQKQKDKLTVFRDYDFMKLKDYDYIVLWTERNCKKLELFSSFGKDFAINFTTHRKYNSFMGRYVKSETEIIDKKYGSIIEIELSYKGGN